jgi:hypothetical protein
LSGQLGSLLFYAEDGTPPILHAPNRPAFGHGFVASLAKRYYVGLGVTGPLALGVGVMDAQEETLAIAEAMPETTYITELPFW